MRVIYSTMLCVVQRNPRGQRVDAGRVDHLQPTTSIKAKTIVSIGADFLANWLTSNLYAVDYAGRRKPEGEWMSRHFQFETNMSLTGTNADTRVAIRPDQHGKVAAALLARISGSGNANVEGVRRGCACKPSS